MPEALQRSLDSRAHLLLRLARLLLEAGADSEDTRRSIEAISNRWAMTAQLIIGSERLLLMLGDGDAYQVRVGHGMGALGVDVGRLSSLEVLVHGLNTGACGTSDADKRLDDLERRPPTYPEWMTVMAVGGSAAALARLFGADAYVVGAALGAGVLNALMRRALPKLGMLPVGVAAVTAAASAATAIAPLHYLGVNPSMAAVAAGMVLVPGVPLINGLRDVFHGHAAMGVARLANGAMIVMAIATGLAAASVMWQLDLPDVMQQGSVSIPWDFLFAGMAALGFAISFNAPSRAIAGIAACGALAHGLRTVAVSLGGDLTTGTAVGSFAAGILAVLLARSMRLPWTAFAFPGVVALVPGSYAFRGMIGALGVMRAGASASFDLVAATLASVTAAGVLTVAIAAGLLMVEGLRDSR
ncbi:threonine/serine exporter family protein [Luteibacter pinisoli]|uniref:Threonine/serine exporter family protein n=1 Tax=Luteibacter pinisoli TaxID=2589080 RepID=A0A4Y5Z5Y0_9GAMM|nr:threonine/serine exporter family protein [Luteibacter pinisoli]QDE39753.1 threonine/serine exporter family protein [Luteibacter pinisoli]